METLKSTVGLPGLFLACIFSAALSTISSELNSLSTVVLEDYIKRYFVKDISEKKAARLSKILCKQKTKQNKIIFESCFLFEKKNSIMDLKNKVSFLT